VWASDAGSLEVRRIAVATLSMPLTRGVIWLEDAHYNACKFDSQCVHSFAWDNVGFDGPAPYRDMTFDVQDALSPGGGGAVNLGYAVNGGAGSAALAVPGVTWRQTPTAAFVGFNWFPFQSPGTVPEVRVNGGPWHSVSWPFDPTVYSWRTIAVEVPMSEIHAGENTVQFRNGTSTIVANVNIILIAASPAS
jgi:hypothetical protein